MKHYCVYTVDIRPGMLRELTDVLEECGHGFEMHLNRSRFWLDEENPQHMQFYIRWSHLLHDISHERDHGLGV